jgi:hypothetical protein
MNCLPGSGRSLAEVVGRCVELHDAVKRQLRSANIEALTPTGAEGEVPCADIY